jgi:hypothetical protein
MLPSSAMFNLLKGLYSKGLDIMIYDCKMITTYVLKRSEDFSFCIQVMIRDPKKAL